MEGRQCPVEEMDGLELLRFYKGKRVFVTGHTGFKGSWLCSVLIRAGVVVTGYALEPPTNPSLFYLLGLGSQIKHVTGDIRDFESLKDAVIKADPEIIFHLAAQPIVRASYEVPRETYETNVMGTVNLLECVRLYGRNVRSLVNVTTDKVYEHPESEGHAFSENERLNGYDPYSNSKSCSELVTQCYARCFLSGLAVSTARAGNVIGGGDFSADRIVPDAYRAFFAGEPLIVRNPDSTRPYQHVLDPIFAYLLLAKEQWFDAAKAGAYNIGPDRGEAITTLGLVEEFAERFENGFSYRTQNVGGPHEASFLSLDNSKAKCSLSWKPVWDIHKAIAMTADWYKEFLRGDNMIELIMRQIEEFENEMGK